MAFKNEDKREAVLKNAFQLFSHNEYKDVFLKDIAERAGLNKSQLQNLYPQKSDIIDKLQRDFHICCFQYVERHVPKDRDLRYKLSLSTVFFWTVIDSNRELTAFYRNITTNYELRNRVIDHVYQWHREMRYEGDTISRNPMLRSALIFSITGGTELYDQKESLNMDVRSIMRILMESFMRITGSEEKHIQDVLNYTDSKVMELNVDEFLKMCRKQLSWFTI